MFQLLKECANSLRSRCNAFFVLPGLYAGFPDLQPLIFAIFSSQQHGRERSKEGSNVCRYVFINLGLLLMFLCSCGD